MRLVRATHEEEALAIACGIRLGGIRTALLVQNAGVLSMAPAWCHWRNAISFRC
jgi:sulfopyruvate decarboxylase subunit alpha